MYACLAVTCHLHFWQNDRDFLRATVVTRGWNGYRNKSQHRKSTLEKKILPPFQQGFEPATFQSRVRRSNHWAIPAPQLGLYWLIIAYIALFSALLSRLTALACGSTWVASFIARFLNIHRSGVLTALAWLVTHETAAVSAHVLCTPYNHAPCHFMQSHIRKVYACLAVTCHLHFWQNDRDLLRGIAVTRGWNGYRNKNQHRKSTLEKKILPPLQQGFEPATFQSRVRRSNHWVIPAYV